MMMKNTFVSLTVCLCAGSALAQDLKMPSNDAIAEQRKQIAETMNAVSQKDAPVPTSRTIQAGVQGNSAGSAVDAARNLSAQGYQDVSKATRDQFEKMARGNTSIAMPRIRKGESDLIVFVSLSMPTQMLMGYAKQAKRFGAILMMRGFVDDKMSATRDTVDRLNTQGVEWQINPEPFKKFKVEKVPSIVLASAEDEMSVTQDGCATPDAFTMVSGDIQIIDALDKMKVLGQPKISGLAQKILLADRASGNQGSVRTR